MIHRMVQLGWRQLLLLAALCAFAALIARNLFYWQVTQHARIASAAAQVYYQETSIPAARGDISDDQGQPLVTSTPTYLVWADPQQVSAPRREAAELAGILHSDPAHMLALLTQPGMEYVVVAHQVDVATGNRLHLPGVFLTHTWSTAYPQGALAAPLLGFVNDNNVGSYGLEQRYNDLLTGTPGTQTEVYDTQNRPLPVGIPQPRPPVDGASLRLTIDARIQYIVEQRLAAAIQRYGAVNGSAIVMDPHTGAILAMASLPSFDPNTYAQTYATNPDLFVNHALENYQPGSTFKVVSMAAGLDDHAFTPATTVYDPGYLNRYGIEVHNWTNGSGWGPETPEIVLYHSANVGMAQFADMIKPTTVYYNYLTARFGFGTPTGVDLPNEDAGAVRTPLSGNWEPMDLLTNSYGQGIDVTPLQLVTAVAALANGGVRMRPYIVQQIEYPDGHIWTARPHAVTQAVSPATATTLTGIMRAADYGLDAEALCAMTPNYPVAAKTGTATIEPPNAHALDLNLGTVASLIGYAPANNPRFVMLIEVRHPQPGPNGYGIYGATVAAPAWHDIAEKLYRLMDIPAQPGSTPADVTTLQGPTGQNCGFMP